jgi:hypothetical protein
VTEQKDSPEEAGLSPLRALIRRVLAARIRDPDVLDDLVQETLTRLMEARPRSLRTPSQLTGSDGPQPRSDARPQRGPPPPRDSSARGSPLP